MVTFEYEGVKITLKPATARARMRLNQLRRTYPDYFQLPDDEQALVDEVLHLLYLVDSVDGDPGFTVPLNGNTTPSALKACVDGIFESPEQLYVNWVLAVHQARHTHGNDADLVPPEELDDEKKMTPKSKPNGGNSD